MEPPSRSKGTALRRISCSIAIAVLSAAVGFSLLSGQGAIGYWVDQWRLLFDDVDQQIHSLQDRYGLSIRYDAGSEALPELWRMAPANGIASPISREGLSRYLHLLPKELTICPNRAR